MPPLLSYADIISMNYIPASAGIVLSAAEQTMAVQAVACFGFSELWSDYEANADAIEALVASTLNSLLVTEIPPPVVGMQSEVTLSPITMDVAIGNAIAPFFATGIQRDNIAYAQNPAIASQSLTTNRFMANGGWRYRITSVRSPGSGVLKLELNAAGGANLATLTHDLYVAGANQMNQYQTGTFTIPTAQKVFFNLTTNGKNAASAAFNLFVTWIEMWRDT